MATSKKSTVRPTLKNSAFSMPSLVFVGRLRSLARLYGSIRIHFSVSSHVSLLPDPYVLAGLNLHYDLLAWYVSAPVHTTLRAVGGRKRESALGLVAKARRVLPPNDAAVQNG